MRRIINAFFAFTAVLLLTGSALAAVDEAKLFKMIDSNDIKGLRTAIEGGLDLNKEYSKPDLNGLRPRKYPLISYAVIKRKPDIVHLLIKEGANTEVLATALTNETPLLLAVWKASLERKPEELKVDLDIIRMLLAAGANVNAKTRDPDGISESGWVALHFAVMIPDIDRAIEVCRLLIEQGADVNAETESGITPLEAAIAWFPEGRRTRLIKYLKDHGAKWNISFKEYLH